MNFNTEPIKNWFGFTRRERRSTFSLLVIIVVILIIRYSIPNSNSTVEDLTSTIIDSGAESKHDSSKPSQVKVKKAYLNKGAGNRIKRISAVYTSYQADKRKLKKPIDINLSDTSELVKLPGIGSVLSARIVKYRTYLGGYSKIEQLEEVYGLSEETFELIKKDVVADSAFITRVNINSADYKGLSRVRYLDKYEITSLLKYRQLKGKIFSINDLIVNKIISYEKARKVSPYLKFE
jgi:competence ComEA-like helix-hairpin-helix protein